jgi:hypothetical protein
VSKSSLHRLGNFDSCPCHTEPTQPRSRYEKSISAYVQRRMQTDSKKIRLGKFETKLKAAQQAFQTPGLSDGAAAVFNETVTVYCPHCASGRGWREVVLQNYLPHFTFSTHEMFPYDQGTCFGSQLPLGKARVRCPQCLLNMLGDIQCDQTVMITAPINAIVPIHHSAYGLCPGSEIVVTI